MRIGLISFFTFVLVLSCTSEHRDRNNPVKSPNDSMLIDYVSRSFGYEEPYKRELPKQLAKIRNGEYNDRAWTNDTILGDYRLQSFNFDIIGYCPFVVEVTRGENEFVSYFTFTDEIFFLYNHSDIKLLSPDSVRYARYKRDEHELLQKINLEKNFNALIDTLGYQRNRLAVQNLIEIVFHDLLNMTRVDHKESVPFIESKELHERYSDRFGQKYASYIVARLKREYDIFDKSGTGKTDFVFRSQEGVFGYWKFWIIEVNGLYRLRSSFFCDFAFQAMWL